MALELYSIHYTMKYGRLRGFGGIGTVLAIVVGLFGSVLALRTVAPRTMMNETESPYDFAETAARFEGAVEDADGWNLLGQYDLQAKMDRHGYVIDEISVFDVCSPEYASNILLRDDERIVSPLMPCRIAIYQKSDGQTYVTRMNAGLVSRLFGGVVERTMSDAHADAEAMVEATVGTD